MVDAAKAQAMGGAATGAIGTPIGRLHLEQPDRFTAELVSSELRFCEFMGRYDRLVGGRPRTLRSPDYNRGLGTGTTPDSQLLEDEDQERQAEDAVKAFQSIRSGLDGLGERTFSVVYNVALLHQHCPSWEQAILRDGLEWLARYFGMMPPVSAQARAA